MHRFQMVPTAKVSFVYFFQANGKHEFHWSSVIIFYIFTRFIKSSLYECMYCTMLHNLFNYLNDIKFTS